MHRQLATSFTRKIGPGDSVPGRVWSVQHASLDKCPRPILPESRAGELTESCAWGKVVEARTGCCWGFNDTVGGQFSLGNGMWLSIGPDVLQASTNLEYLVVVRVDGFCWLQGTRDESGMGWAWGCIGIDGNRHGFVRVVDDVVGETLELVIRGVDVCIYRVFSSVFVGTYEERISIDDVGSSSNNAEDIKPRRNDIRWNRHGTRSNTKALQKLPRILRP
ncbi:hypothetical protein WN55_09712 [Dufourea novaeangliae]|uniref:Uncharacterized protein n=1 Tax=Dufourea novaeangliae TaxID=178035 RepID=A0A154NZ67_DUFNO|nr:hypothetical protein WN55_09712 [Dufourea novaeangliae]